MQFNLQTAIPILERTPDVVSALLKDLHHDWINSNEGPDTWSPYDIVGHYITGEKTDYMQRLNIILGDQSDKHFAPFDRFAQFRDSQGKSLDQLLDEFAMLRKQNVDKLKTLTIDEDTLNKTGIHPAFGEVTLRQLLATWVVHDLNHIYQLSRVLSKQYMNEVGPWKQYLGVLNH